ncbi:hypothetical protein [Falsirhodobacter sp. 1013]|uniref:hypothetical protein n=1 Tax=Falsirhodobacter sp. 1013 TaxID=3417566 RepID=UPI003EC0B1CC
MSTYFDGPDDVNCDPDRDPPPRLYHYTDMKGLDAILQSGNLRCSHLARMNDYTEIIHGLDFLKEMADSDLRDDRRLQSMGQAQHAELEALICSASLSEVGDQLSQWRGYTKDGGANLGSRPIDFTVSA